MAINKAWIEEGCIACDLCVEICPEVFELPDDTAIVKDNVNLSDYEEQIKDAASECPVDVIRYE
jgi:ferredoxin